MRLDAFDYDLPEELIALRPARPRPASRLLVATAARMADSTVARLPDWLERGDLLVLNDTRVIPARLAGVRRRASGGEARIEATLIAHAADGAWRALARPGKRLAVGDRIEFGGGLTAAVQGKDGAEVLLGFDRDGAALAAALEAVGEMPLPPYIAARRPADAADRQDYQTVFAARPGAVAAPTASLHFDAGAAGRARGAGGGAHLRDAARRRRHLPAGQGRGDRGAPDAQRVGRDRRRRRRGDRRDAWPRAGGWCRSAPRRCG